MINPIKIIKMRISLPNNCKTDINLPPKVSSLGIKLNITLDNKMKIVCAVLRIQEKNKMKIAAMSSSRKLHTLINIF